MPKGTKVEKRVTLVADCSRDFNSYISVLVLTAPLVRLILRRMDKFKAMKKSDRGLAYFQFWDEPDWFSRVDGEPPDMDCCGGWTMWHTAPVQITGETAKMDASRMIVGENDVRWEGYDHYADTPLVVETPALGRKFLEDFLGKKKGGE